MKVLQHINKLFCTLLFFSAGNKSYSQREIHPLEPMFTYDYALKYFNNEALNILSSREYWFLDNFKTSTNVCAIEEYYYHDDSLFYGYSRYLSNSTINPRFPIVKIYNYNSETRFLEKSISISVNKKYNIILDTLEVKNYSYDIDSLFTKIIVSSKKNNSHSQYIFQNSTQNLIKVITNEKDTISYTYTDDSTISQHIKEIKDSKSLSTISYTKLDYNLNRDVLNYLQSANLNNFLSLIPSSCYKTSNINGLIAYSDLRLEKDSIYHFTRRFNEKADYLNLLVYDDDKKIKEFYIIRKEEKEELQSLIQRNKHAVYLQDADLDVSSIFNGFQGVILRKTKENGRKWGLYFIDKIASFNSPYFIRQMGTFSLKNGAIYFLEKPIIIYKYKNDNHANIQ